MSLNPTLSKLSRRRETENLCRTTYRCSTPTPFSTTVAHDCSMKRLAHNSKSLHGSPRSARVRPAPDPIPTSRLYPTLFNHRFSLPHPPGLLLRFRTDSRQLQHLYLAPFNFHKTRVRRAIGFLLTAFSNARPNALFRYTLLTKGAPPKKH